jgi:hypothetical protein
MTPITTGDIVARSLTVSSALVRPGELRSLEARETVGKVVLVPDSG